MNLKFLVGGLIKTTKISKFHIFVNVVSSENEISKILKLTFVLNIKYSVIIS
jgi:hypothetical protein